jgi:hypothetical protein
MKVSSWHCSPRCRWTQRRNAHPTGPKLGDKFMKPLALSIEGSMAANNHSSALATPRLDRSMIEAAIRGNCFLGQYGDVPAVNGITVAADAIWALHCADLALVERERA